MIYVLNLQKKIIYRPYIEGEKMYLIFSRSVHNSDIIYSPESI